MMKHEFLELLPGYATGTLNAREQASIEAHLKQGCEVCEAELVIFLETFHRLPYALPSQELPPELKEKIRQRLGREIQMDAKARGTNWGFLLRVAAVAAFLAIAIAIYHQKNDALLKKETQIAQIEKQLRELRQEVNNQKQEISWLRDPSVQLAMLVGMQQDANARAKIVWNPNASRGVFFVNSLPPLPAEKSYQLWVIGAQGPVSAGVFDTTQQGSAVVTISKIDSPVPNVLQFAVTIEPRGGLPKPSGSIVLAGKPL
jgi:anti-sigma-K factor RskA